MEGIGSPAEPQSGSTKLKNPRQAQQYTPKDVPEQRITDPEWNPREETRVSEKNSSSRLDTHSVADNESNEHLEYENEEGEHADGHLQDEERGQSDNDITSNLKSGSLHEDFRKVVSEKGQVLDEDENVLRHVPPVETVDEDENVLPHVPPVEAVDEDGNVLQHVPPVEAVDEDGNVLQHVPPVEAVDQVDSNKESLHKMPSLSTLEGYTVNKLGKVVNDENVPVGELIEGDPTRLSKLGVRLDDKGQFWDGRGNIIGKVQPIPVQEKEAEAAFADLDGLIVARDGWVVDGNDNRIGKIVEGDAKRLVGRTVDEDGDILDKHGNVVGHADRWEEPEAPELEKIDLSSLAGLTVNKIGNVIGPEGVPIARVVEGNLNTVAGKKIDSDGQIWDDVGRVIGRVQLIPVNEREEKKLGNVFSGLDGLVVGKDGLVEDKKGVIVGRVVEGDPQTLRGRTVDENGDISDKYGNVDGRAERYDVPEEQVEEPDLSLLNGKTVNKIGNVVDGSGVVFGRLVSGDPKRLAGKKVDGQGQIWGDNGQVIGRAEHNPGADQDKPEGAFYGFEGAVVGKDGIVVDAASQIIGRVTEGDVKRLQGRRVDEDGDILDKIGNVIGRAERWEPEAIKPDINPMSGRKINRDGEVRDADGNLIGKLTAGNLQNLIGKTIDDNGFVIDNNGNKIGEATLIENIREELEEEPQITPEELEKQQQAENDRKLAGKLCHIFQDTLNQVEPICKQITDLIERADRTPKDELDEEKLVKDVKPLIEEGGRMLQECNGAIRALDPDGHIAATAKARAASHDATPEEYRLAELMKELTHTVVKTIDNGRKRIQDMPHAKKKINPLWGLLTEPLFQILAAVGLLLSGVLGLVSRLLDGLGLGGLVRGLLSGLGVDKLLEGLGLGVITEGLGFKKK